MAKKTEKAQKLNSPTDIHNWLLESWKKPTIFVGSYENDGIYVISGTFDREGRLTEMWNVPAGMVMVKHQIDPDGKTCTTVNQIFMPHDCE